MSKVFLLAVLSGTAFCVWVLAEAPPTLFPEVPAIERVGYGPEVATFGELITKDLPSLAVEAEAIVVARVSDEVGVWDAGGGFIWTETTLAVESCWKGAALDELVLREPGGVIAPNATYVPCAARYAVGERVVVFLIHDVLGQWRTHGVIQGRFAITTNDRGQDLVDLRTVPRHVVERAVADSDGTLPETLPLERFEVAVRSLAMTGKEGR